MNMMGWIISIIYTISYAFFGILISCAVFKKMAGLKKIWFGLTFGLFGMTWMPSLFSFITGQFSILTHILGLVSFLSVALACFFINKKKVVPRCAVFKSDLCVIWLLPLLLLGVKLFSTHILEIKADGLYVGQTTYGDLAMHLGFISSLGAQGVFPPQYSIFPGHAINYPFLCEVSASSLYLFGADLRAAYLISALYAYLLVILGVFFLFKTWLKKNSRSILATYLFFIGGGFGFAYFLNNVNSPSFIGSLLNSSYSTNLSQLLDGYYTTPTNLPDLGLRWVNPIVDMLIPQRATLFGWAFLFPCLTLLYDYMFLRKKTAIVPLAILAAGLPLIHTHSFLALGIISGVYCLYDLISDYQKVRLRYWALYAGIVILLAGPQLFGFTFRQVSESSMVKLHFNWANEKDSWFWFYVKNWGVLFLLLLPGMLLLAKKDRIIMSGPLALWGISEIVIFQPNTYDNNKLIFVFFAYLCGLCAKLLGCITHKLQIKFREKDVYANSSSGIMFTVALLIVFFTFIPALSSRSPVFMGTLKQSNLATLLLLGFVYTYISIRFAYLAVKYQRDILVLPLPLTGLAFCSTILILLLEQSDSLVVQVDKKIALLLRILECFMLILAFLFLVKYKPQKGEKSSAFGYAFYRIAGAVLVCALFLSGSMTIAREWVSTYQVFSNTDIKAADFIKENTDPDSVFLTSYSWHLNTVSVLTGRNIVCGPDLYLYYHGIDTSERKSDVDLMFGDPTNYPDLFEKYQVSYIYIGPDERYSYSIDHAFFKENCEKIYEENGITIYRR